MLPLDFECPPYGVCTAGANPIRPNPNPHLFDRRQTGVGWGWGTPYQERSFTLKEKITITIDGYKMPSPDGYGLSQDTIGHFTRNAAGNMVGDVVAVKDILTLSWKLLSQMDFRLLKNATSPIFAEVEYFNPSTNNLDSKEMLVRVEGASIATVNNHLWWRDVSCTLIER